MSIIKWETGIDYSYKDKALEQEILIVLLTLTPEELNNPWEGSILFNKFAKMVRVKLEKSVRGGSIGAVIGATSSYDRNYLPGTVALSTTGTVSMIESDLKTLWLASRIGNHVLAKQKVIYGYK
jgi:hypothetical protein